MTQYLKIERGGLLPVSRIEFVIETDDGSAFAVTSLGLECLEIDNRFFSGFKTSADYETVCLILQGDD